MTKTTSSRGSSRQKLLDAAADLITQHGVQELTLDAVAAAAGVTKGGLIYHFKTKDDLLGALVEQMIKQIDQRQRAMAAERGASRKAVMLALVDDTFDMPRSERQLLANLLAAASAYPHLLGPVRNLFTQVYGQLTSGDDAVGLPLAIAAALDGVSLLELLDFYQFTKAQREAMRHALTELIKQVD